jgi:rhodanese-related sulfurtransferase
MKNFPYQLIFANQLAGLNPNKSVILDVRTHAEIEQKRLAQKFIHEVLDQLDPESFLARHGLNDETEICVLCHVGGRARRAAEMLVAGGCRNVKVIEGGILACEAAGCGIEGVASFSCTRE